ncbi:MAG: hypothetical protein DRP83_00650 [Planctomycetota bacterium]|nr:MAG: hypothetical protein DRP83_00650 [Planctomycetota bacterium]
MPWYKFSAAQQLEFNDEIYYTPVVEYEYYTDAPPRDVLDEELESRLGEFVEDRKWEEVDAADVSDEDKQRVRERKRATVQHTLETLIDMGAEEEEL